MYKIILLLSFILVSCSSVSSRHSVTTGVVIYSGGVMGEKSWDDKMTFKRTSWYSEANLSDAIILHKLSSGSHFSNWLGSDRAYLSSCSEFYIAALYSRKSKSFLINEIEKSGYRRKSIVTFGKEFSAHSNYADWGLQQYEVMGFCSNGKKQTGKINITIPGYKTQRL